MPRRLTLSYGMRCLHYTVSSVIDSRHLRLLLLQGVKVIVQPSTRRAFYDKEYVCRVLLAARSAIATCSAFHRMLVAATPLSSPSLIAVVAPPRAIVRAVIECKNE